MTYGELLYKGDYLSCVDGILMLVMTDDGRPDQNIETCETDPTRRLDDLDSPITSNHNSIKVNRNLLSVNSHYKVSCEVSDSDGSSYGYVEKTFNTIEFEEEFSFTMRPQNGTAYQTLFELNVIKPLDEALKCEFGYFNQHGEVLIDDQSKIARVHSS